MRRFLLNILALIALALLCALATPTVNAQDSPYSWESIDVLIDVQQNGDILVEETSAYAFHVQHDFFRSRYIDMEFIDHIDQVSVSMDGRDLPVETDRGEQRLSDRLGAPLRQRPGDPHLRSPLPGAGRASFG